jgi:hypothetical protein
MVLGWKVDKVFNLSLLCDILTQRDKLVQIWCNAELYSAIVFVGNG